MQHKMIVVLSVVLLCVTAWAVPDANAPDQARAATPRPATSMSLDGVGAAPTRAVRTPGDIPAGYQPPTTPAATVDEPPQIIEMKGGAAGAGPVEPRPLWGPDVTVYDGGLKYMSEAGSERMIAYDQSEGGTLFAAFTVPNGDTARIYRSTDDGTSWAYWNAIVHTGNVLSSLKLVVAEGDSSFVFFFVKSSAGNGNIYVGRWALDGSTANVFSVKVDADTVVNLSACRDIENPYYLYVAYERRAADYGMYQLRSTDYGKTWAETGGEVVNNQTSPKPDICYGSDGNVYAVLRDLRQSSSDSVQLRLKRSTDRGATWLGSSQVGSVVVPVYDPVVGAKHDSPNTVWVLHTRDLQALNGTGDAVCYWWSTDNGDTWTNGSFLGPNTAEDECMPSIACRWSTGSATACYTVIPGDSLWFTWASSATNWSTPEKVNDYSYTGWFAPQAGWKGSYSSVLYAGVGASGLYFDAFYMTGMEEGHPVTEKPAALVARPSPARDHAVMEYNLPRAGTARVSVLDIAGREVAVLAHGMLTAGTHSAAWDCANVPAGVYLVRIETGTGTQTGRIVVSH
jgi:hypothetical protein